MKYLIFLLLPGFLFGKISDQQVKAAEQLYLNYKFKEAYPVIKQAAAEGDQLGLVLLASYYANGYNTLPVNLYQAQMLYESAAKKGSFYGRFMVNTAYYLGIGRVRNRLRAVTELKKLLEEAEIYYQDHLEQHQTLDLVSPLIMIHTIGMGVMKNPEKGYQYYKIFEKSSFPMIRNMRSIFYSFGPFKKDSNRAIEYLKDGAKNGSAGSQHTIATLYYYDKGDLKSSFKWAMMGANQSHPSSMYLLSKIYSRKGEKTSKTYMRYIYTLLAYHWEMKAAVKGYFRAWNPFLLLLTGNINQ